MNEIYGDQPEHSDRFSILNEKIKQLFTHHANSGVASESSNSVVTRRSVLNGFSQVAVGIVLEPLFPKTNTQVIKPSTTSLSDLSRLIPENVREFLALRKVIRESQDLLRFPEFFYPVGVEIGMPDSFFDNIDTLDLQLFEGQLVAKIALEPLKQMMQSARNDSMSPRILSGYRSYAFQRDTIYEPELQRVKSELRAQQQNALLSETELTIKAEKKVSQYSSKQGFSQHHLGTAFDIVDENHSGFDYARAHWNDGWYGWLRTHAHEYGFILSYPRGKDNETAKLNSGYTSSEPWHIRFVGKPLAQYLQQQEYLSDDFVVTAQSVLIKLHQMSQYGYK